MNTASYRGISLMFSEEEVEFLTRLFCRMLEVFESSFFAVVGEVVLLDEAGDFTHL